MGYLSIPNLYQTKELLLFRKVYALEKIHGTSASVEIRTEGGKRKVQYFTGDNPRSFESLFHSEELLERAHDLPDLIMYGEHYGGKILKQSHRYGEQKRFVAFDIYLREVWLDVPNAEDVAQKLGQEFVPYEEVMCDPYVLDIHRDAPSVQADRNGVSPAQIREGIIIRPLIEMQLKTGRRLIAKHKRAEFSETYQPRQLHDPSPEYYQAAETAEYWVTRNRLINLISHHGFSTIEQMPDVIRAMIADVHKECDGSVADTKEVRKALAAKTSKVYRSYLEE